MKVIFSALLATLCLAPQYAFALGASIEVNKVQRKSAGEPYVGIGQRTRELRRVDSEVTFIEYQLNGESRRLWDDDGLGTLFLYQRSITSKYHNQELKLNSPLPMPKAPLVTALAKLEAEYEKLMKHWEEQKNEEGLMQAKKNLERIRKVKTYVASNRFREVSDLENSGLESLINDLDSNHTYQLEVGDDKTKRNKLSHFLAQGSPATLSDGTAARCRDTIQMNWKAVTASYNGESGNNRGVSVGGDDALAPAQ